MNAISRSVALSAILVNVEAGWPDAPATAQYRLANALAHLSGGDAGKVATAQFVVDAVAAGVAAGAWPEADDLHVAAGLIHSSLAYAQELGRDPRELALLGHLLRTGEGAALGVEVTS
jgi:hypothetical protein